MRRFKPQLYIQLIEKTTNTFLKEQIEEEIDIVNSIESSEDKVLIDLGAGYGRAWNHFTTQYRKLIGVEINPKMASALFKNSKNLNNSLGIEGDITKLQLIDEVLAYDKVVFMLLQNTLGVVEGEWEDVIEEIKNYDASKSKELILSTFRANALKEIGIPIYQSLQQMLGEPDIDECDFINGFIQTTSGYEAKWWKDEELDDILSMLGAEIIEERSSKLYKIFHLKL